MLASFDFTETRIPLRGQPDVWPTGRPRLRGRRRADAQRFRRGVTGPRVPSTFARSRRRVRGRKSWRAARSGRVNRRLSEEFLFVDVRTGPAWKPPSFK